MYALNLGKLCEEEKIDVEDLVDSIVLGPKSQQNIEDLKWYFIQTGLPKLANKISKSDRPLR